MATSVASGPGKTCPEQATDQELEARLDKVLEEYRGRPGALIPVLQMAQGIYGYLPVTALKRIARVLDKSYSEVAGVVGFYSFFSTVPRGKHLVRVCLGTACYVKGATQILQAIKDELKIDFGEVTPDGLFSLGPARCLGACGLAPVVMIDDKIHGELTPKKIVQVLKEYRKQAGKEDSK